MLVEYIDKSNNLHMRSVDFERSDTEKARYVIEDIAKRTNLNIVDLC